MVAAADIPLRQRKQAQTRQALLRAVVERLDGRRTLDEINVKELCREADISEASFFNYFPKKSDVLVYFVQVWSLGLAWRVRHELAGRSARAAIEAIFASTAREVREHPGVMAEILAHQARMAEVPRAADLPLADRVVAYPDRPGIEDVPGLGLDGLLPPLIDRAVREGELPAAVDRRAAFLALTAIFFGVPLVLRRIDPALVEPAYRQQLDIVWTGLQQHAARPTSSPRRRAARGGKS